MIASTIPSATTRPSTSKPESSPPSAGDLSHGRATPQELAHLTDLLSSTPTTLPILSLSHNTLFPDHIESLFHTIAHTTHTHNISEIRCDATHVGDTGVAAICAAIVGNGTGMTHTWGAPAPTIPTVPAPVASPPSVARTSSMSNKHPSQSSPQPLIIVHDPFIHHPDAQFLHLHTLSLCACHVTQISIPLIARLLRIHRHLLHLSLAYNIEIYDINEIATVLATENTTLVSFDVSSCSIPSSGITALTHAIQHHPALLACHVDGNIHSPSDTPAWNTARTLLATAIAENRYARVRICKLAFVMGLHPRIGVHSAVRTLLKGEEKHQLVELLAPVWEYLGQV